MDHGSPGFSGERPGLPDVGAGVGVKISMPDVWHRERSLSHRISHSEDPEAVSSYCFLSNGEIHFGFRITS